jgi:TRAP-type C4-dicarboxylate transport system permease small subunit
MSNRTRVMATSLVAAILFLGGFSMAAWSQQAATGAADAVGIPAAESSTAGTVLMAQSAASGAAESPVATRGLAPPPTPLQTAGALLGALFAIVLAIAGVTLTFRSMRNEMRRGRGRSRRTSRSERSTLPQT